MQKNPKDSYLEYVALQLARRKGKLDDFVKRYPKERLNLFDSFTSADAMQKDLQREVMLGRSVVNHDQEFVDISTLPSFQFDSKTLPNTTLNKDLIPLAASKDNTLKGAMIKALQRQLKK